jgi:nicotinamide mononucleotide transporter
MSVFEILGFVTGAVCVWLQTKENVWNWPIGIANNLLFLVLFWRTRLYADSLLQFFYIAVSIYGLYFWLRGGQAHTAAVIRRANKREGTLIGLAAVAAAFTIYFLLVRFSDSNTPLGDSITTALSLAAQYMLGRKWIENWIVWIVANVLYIALYNIKHLYLTAFLYLIFIGLCVEGYRQWTRTQRKAALAAAAS